MNRNPVITGLSKKQKVLCDIMWSIDTKERLEQFVMSLPDEDQLQCMVLIEMMKMSIIDEISYTDDAEEVLRKFTGG